MNHSGPTSSNPYLIPSLFLFGIVGICFLLLITSKKKLDEQRASVEDISVVVSQLNQNIKIQEATLTTVKNASAPVNLFMQQWSQHLTGDRDGNAILNDLSRFGNEQNVSVQGRRSSAGEAIWQGGMVNIALAYGTGVSSEYFRLLNWLGQVEGQWPLARFESIDFVQKGGTLTLNVRIAYPSFILDRLAQ